MAPTAESKARFYATTLDAETHKADIAMMARLGTTKSELTRMALAKYLGMPKPDVRMGRPPKGDTQ